MSQSLEVDAYSEHIVKALASYCLLQLSSLSSVAIGGCLCTQSIESAHHSVGTTGVLKNCEHDVSTSGNPLPLAAEQFHYLHTPSRSRACSAVSQDCEASLPEASALWTSILHSLSITASATSLDECHALGPLLATFLLDHRTWLSSKQHLHRDFALHILCLGCHQPHVGLRGGGGSQHRLSL